ncbi:MAG: family 10 glycosylhydrolase [Nitriliruptoraceae bacterium]
MRVVTAMLALLLGVVSCTTPTNETSEVSPPAVPEEDVAGDAEERPAVGSGDAAPTDAQAPVVDQWRASWVHLFDDTLKSVDSIDALVDEAAAAGVNVILVQVARRHDAYYQSGHLPRTNDPTMPADLDVLAELIPRAHAAHIQVHAWVGLAPTWHAVYEGIDAPAGWVSTEHGPNAAESDRWVTRSVDGEWSTYLDPALPEVREHLIATITDIADRYPVDGIHLDYVRYESQRHGYHPRNLASFAAETGRSDIPAPDDARWSDWRRERTRQVIVDAAAALALHEVTLSAATIAWGGGPDNTSGFAQTNAYTDTLQDWNGWVRDGLLDAVLPMVYFRAHEPDQAANFDQWIDYLAGLSTDDSGAGTVTVVPGIGGWLNGTDDVAGQITAARTATGHVAVYSYQQPTSDEIADFWKVLGADGW